MTVNMQDSVRIIISSEVNTRMYYGAEGVIQRGVAAWTNKNDTQQTMTQ